MSYMKSLAVVSKQTTTALSSLSYCALIHRVDVTLGVQMRKKNFTNKLMVSGYIIVLQSVAESKWM